MDKLFDSNNKLKTIVANQTALIQRILDDTHIQTVNLIEEQLQQEKQANEKAHLIVSFIIQLDEIINSITLGKQGIISSQMINPDLFLKTFENITKANMLPSNIEQTIQNFQIL